MVDRFGITMIPRLSVISPVCISNFLAIFLVFNDRPMYDVAVNCRICFTGISTGNKRCVFIPMSSFLGSLNLGSSFQQ